MLSRASSSLPVSFSFDWLSDEIQGKIKYLMVTYFNRYNTLTSSITMWLFVHFNVLCNWMKQRKKERERKWSAPLSCFFFALFLSSFLRVSSFFMCHSPAWVIQSRYPLKSSSICAFSRCLWKSPRAFAFSRSFENSLADERGEIHLSVCYQWHWYTHSPTGTNVTHTVRTNETHWDASVL